MPGYGRPGSPRPHATRRRTDVQKLHARDEYNPRPSTNGVLHDAAAHVPSLPASTHQVRGFACLKSRILDSRLQWGRALGSAETAGAASGSGGRSWGAVFERWVDGAYGHGFCERLRFLQVIWLSKSSSGPGGLAMTVLLAWRYRRYERASRYTWPERAGQGNGRQLRRSGPLRVDYSVFRGRGGCFPGGCGYRPDRG